MRQQCRLGPRPHSVAMAAPGISGRPITRLHITPGGGTAET